MAKNVLEKAENATDSAIDWVAAEFKYMRDTRNDLVKARDDPFNSLQSVNKAKRDFAYAGRAEYRAKRKEDDVEAALIELANALPDEQKRAVLAREHQIDIEMKQIEKFSSRYMGALRAKMDDLAVQVDLLVKKRGSVVIVRQLSTDIVAKFDMVIEWINALLIDLRRAKELERKIEAWVNG